MFTGSIANATSYHVCLIEKDSDLTIDAGFDTSVTCVNRPAGYTKFRRVGSLLTDGSANFIGFIHRGDDFIWKTPILDIADTGVASATTEALSIPGGIGHYCSKGLRCPVHLAFKINYEIAPKYKLNTKRYREEVAEICKQALTADRPVDVDVEKLHMEIADELEIWPGDVKGVLEQCVERNLLAGAPVGGDGHGETCVLCGVKCNNLAASPSLWANCFPKPYGSGTCQTHCMKCVIERVYRPAIPGLQEAVEALEKCTSYPLVDPDGNETGQMAFALDVPWEHYEIILQAARQSGVPEGYVIVPREPTEEMIDAWNLQDKYHDSFFGMENYKAMISAAGRV